MPYTVRERAAIKEQLRRILRSAHFAGNRRRRASPTQSKLLTFLVLAALALKRTPTERRIGCKVWGYPPNWEIDANRIVYVTLGHVLDRLEAYYATDGIKDIVRIGFPKGFALEVVFRNSPADVHYVRGMRILRHSIIPTDLKTAIEHFDAALAVNPTYAAAYAGKVDALCQMSWYLHEQPPSGLLQQAHVAAQRAVAVGKSEWYSHVAIGIVAQSRYQWDEAEEAFQTALRINKQATRHHQWFYNYLDFHGKIEETALLTEEASDNAPDNITALLDHAYSLYFTRRFDEALQLLLEVRSMDRYSARAHGMLAQVYLALNRPKDALESARSLHELSESVIASGLITLCEALLGNEDEARKRLTQLKRQESSRYVPKMMLAIAYMGLGEADNAMDALEAACEEYEPWIMYLHILPMLDPLREHPRFKDLLFRLRLPYV